MNHEWQVKSPRLFASSTSEDHATFFARFGNHFPKNSPDYLQIKLAYILSKHGHRDQPRKETVAGVPIRYFEHPRDVALLIWDELEYRDKDAVILGLTHDCDEDSKDIDLIFLGYYFGDGIRYSLGLLSNKDFKDDPGGLQKYVNRILVHQFDYWKVLLVKCADILSNIRSWPDREAGEKQLATKIPAYLPIIEALHESACIRAEEEELSVAHKLRALIHGALREQCEKFNLPMPIF